MTLRLFRFFLQTDSLARGIEFDHAVTLRVAHLVSENACAALEVERVTIKIKFPVENIVAENERCAGVADEFGANQKGLGNPFRFRLLRVLDADAKLRAVAQITAEHRHIFRRRNEEHFAQTAQHERGEWIADHRLVVNGEKLFADDFGQGEETGPGATGEKNGFLVHELVFGFLSTLSWLHRASNSDHSCQKLACLVKLIPIFSSSRRIVFFGKEMNCRDEGSIYDHSAVRLRIDVTRFRSNFAAVPVAAQSWR